MDCQVMGVSVVMPAYNAEKTIEPAIKSVIEQSYSRLELIVVDDCSGDDTAKIVQKWASYDDRIKYLRNETN